MQKKAKGNKVRIRQASDVSPILLLHSELINLTGDSRRRDPLRYQKLAEIAGSLTSKVQFEVGTNVQGGRSWVAPLLVVADMLAANPAYAAQAEAASRAAASNAFFDPMLERGAINIWLDHLRGLSDAKKVVTSRTAVTQARDNSLFKRESESAWLRAFGALSRARNETSRKNELDSKTPRKNGWAQASKELGGSKRGSRAKPALRKPRTTIQASL